ncbi:phage tail sheath subtilisin-like domain-containing protein [Sorangium sp. So ce375]|uniref:phage tail sheath family protein n=1 Tax=Sorangium sp. So ce375 TaxID=3133306 RepID=UPI003F5C1913
MADYSSKAPGVYVEQVPSGSAPIGGVGTSTAGFVGVVPDSVTMPEGQTIAKVGEVKLVTNFTEFKNSFGDFSKDRGQSLLAHAVYGFFLNGGTRCWVTRVAPTAPAGGGEVDYGTIPIADALALFEPIEEIAIVAAPGLSSKIQTGALSAHCEKVETRVAVLDTPETLETDGGQPDFGVKLAKNGAAMPDNSDFAALYFPWIQVYDPASKKPKFVPPSGHVAGIYARVDAQRGVHKAPANETVLGALETKYAISRAQQDGLNAHGVNCIRRMNGNIRVWGARTVGGSANTEFMYLNVRRVFNYLRGSIDQGTQWAVFEPNDPDLWAKITRNVTAFLTNVWNAGALFGSKAEQAFYVKCDAETNPPSLRDIGQVTTEIGVAITRPAEFVVFKLGQKAES